MDQAVLGLCTMGFLQLGHCPLVVVQGAFASVQQKMPLVLAIKVARRLTEKSSSCHPH